MKKLENKVAIVTGAGKGIGAAIARTLGAEGAAVIVNYASASADAQRTVDAIVGAGGRAIAIQADVSQPVEVKRLFAETKERFGRLDVLVNNAGRYGFGPLESVTVEEFHRQTSTNVLGILLTCQAAVGAFGPEGGSIVNIGSAASSSSSPGTVLYTATKHAVDGITGVLAKELASRKIRVNSVNPGATETEGAHALGMMGGDFMNQIIAGTPLGRLGQPSDIAPVVAFLASSDAGWLTGETLVVSGGVR
jgi:3-oxoacyl-[acyl-carrier protein] reductase